MHNLDNIGKHFGMSAIMLTHFKGNVLSGNVSDKDILMLRTVNASAMVFYSSIGCVCIMSSDAMSN